MLEGIPNPGLTIHPNLHPYPFVWRICPVEISYRQHYAILPGVTTVTMERATGWHVCHFGNNKKDGWYYLEHYLAMEERRELEFPTRGAQDWGANIIYVVTIRPAFDWPEYYRLSPPGYRQYGLYFTMGSGLGPISALDGVHKQPSLPGIKFHYKPDSPEHRMGHGFFVADNEAKPDYAELAFDSQHLLPVWQGWIRHHYGLISAAQYQPEQLGYLLHLAKQDKKSSLNRYRHDQANAFMASREHKRRLQLQGEVAQSMARGQVPIEFEYLLVPGPPGLPPPLVIGGNTHQVPYPQNHQILHPQNRQVPYPQNYQNVHPNTALHIDPNYRQGGRGKGPASLVRPQLSSRIQVKLADSQTRHSQNLSEHINQSPATRAQYSRVHPDQHQLQILRLAKLEAAQRKSISSMLLCIIRSSGNPMLIPLNTYRLIVETPVLSEEPPQ